MLDGEGAKKGAKEILINIQAFSAFQRQKNLNLIKIINVDLRMKVSEHYFIKK